MKKIYSKRELRKKTRINSKCTKILVRVRKAIEDTNTVLDSDYLIDAIHLINNEIKELVRERSKT